jgi:hypothetical protein
MNGAGSHSPEDTEVMQSIRKGAEESSTEEANLDRFLEISISTVDGSITRNTIALVLVEPLIIARTF